jgi:hypothetical protein
MREAKKMDSLLKDAVRARVLEKTANGEYGIPSGRNEDDFDNWMLKKMFNWDKLFGASGGGEDDDNKEDDGIDLNESKEDDEKISCASPPQQLLLPRNHQMSIPFPSTAVILKSSARAGMTFSLHNLNPSM